MTNVELQLRDLGTAIAFPETPDLTAAVRTRLEAPPRRRWLGRRTVAIAFAAFVVALAGVLAVPSARTAILEWLGIRGVELEFVDKLPTRAVARDPDLGERTTLAEARRRARFDVVEPPSDLGDPAVYFREPPEGGLVSFLYGTPDGGRLLISEFRGDYRPFIRKFVDPTVRAASARVDGEPALWLAGAHGIVYEDSSGEPFEETVRLADKVLLWQHNGLTFRLEGALTKAQAVEIAEAVT